MTKALRTASMLLFFLLTWQLLAISHAACPLPIPIDDGVTWERTLYVSTTGSDSGNGSIDLPFATIARAAQEATPGTQILVQPGIYGAVSIDNLAGMPNRPIGIVANGEVTLDAGGAGTPLLMSDPTYVVLEGLTLAGASVHGMNISDGGSYDTPAHHLVLRNLTIAGAGSGGNNDCIKLSGVDDFWVLNSDVSGCNSGEIIDMVGCHRGVISGNYFHDTVGSGVQTKGGSEDTIIHGNVFERIPGRAVNAGGSTGSPYFRPIDAPHEAARIRILSNLFVDNGMNYGAAVAYVGCDACIFAQNTIIEPRSYVARILQENTNLTASRNGLFVNNLVVLRTGDLNTFVNVGSGTEPETFTFSNNLWFALDEGPSWAGPSYCCGITETASIIQQDPMMVDRTGADYHLTPGSPAIGAGRTVPGDVFSDFEGRCYANPPSLGAFEIPNNSEFAAGFGANGLWTCDGSSWNRINTWNVGSSGLTGWSDGLVADFDTNGLWNFNGSIWRRLTSWDAEDDLTDWIGGLAVDFSDNGLWGYDELSWTKLTSWNPASMTGYGDGLVVDFDVNGLWNFDGSSWYRITTWNVGGAGLADWSSGLAADFDANGLWNFDGSVWHKLTTWDPENDLTGWTDGLAVDFGPNGLWSYDGSSWRRLTTWDPGVMTGYADGLAVDFNANGIWTYDGSSWNKLTNWDPENLDDVDFN